MKKTKQRGLQDEETEVTRSLKNAGGGGKRMCLSISVIVKKSRRKGLGWGGTVV